MTIMPESREAQDTSLGMRLPNMPRRATKLPLYGQIEGTRTVSLSILLNKHEVRVLTLAGTAKQSEVARHSAASVPKAPGRGNHNLSNSEEGLTHGADTSALDAGPAE